MALAYLTATATQGSADAFVQAEMATALSGITNVAYRVREILFECSATILNLSSDVQMTLTRRSKAAIPNVTDRDLIAAVKRKSAFTTSGAQNGEVVYRLAFSEDDELLIVEDPLYFQLDSTSTTLTSVAHCRVGYERVSISALDRLSLLTQSLD